MRIKLQQAIVVEGKYDKNVLSQLVDAPIFVTNGFGIFKDKARVALLRRVAEARGLIVFTDADGAGFVIRNRIKSAIGEQYLLHAYTPDVFGKERRKRQGGKEGKLGVEGMTKEILLRALRQAGAQATAASAPEITKADLYALGLSGTADAQARRLALLKRLELPEHLSSNALLEVLNALYTPDSLAALLDESENGETQW